MRQYVPRVKYFPETGMYYIMVGKVITKYSFYDRKDAILWSLNVDYSWKRPYEYYNKKANEK